MRHIDSKERPASHLCTRRKKRHISLQQPVGCPRPLTQVNLLRVQVLHRDLSSNLLMSIEFFLIWLLKTNPDGHWDWADAMLHVCQGSLFSFQVSLFTCPSGECPTWNLVLCCSSLFKNILAFWVKGFGLSGLPYAWKEIISSFFTLQSEKPFQNTSMISSTVTPPQY